MKKNGYTVVSGCPRSGTSLMMDIHRTLYGEDLIFGSKFPQMQRKLELESLLEDDDVISELRKYYIAKNERHREVETTPEDRNFEDMNPNGFWECFFSVQGIRFAWHVRDELASVLTKRKVVKVVSQGLMNSDTMYMNRIIYMLRHPRAVAKSQEKLHREFNVLGEDGEVHNLYKDDWVIHTPEMFINVTIAAMRFFLLQKDIPVLIINFEDLIHSPVDEIKKVYEFNDMGGDIDEAADLIEPKLNRSKAQDIEHDLWGDAEYLHSTMKKFKELKSKGQDEKAYAQLELSLEYITDPKREWQKSQKVWRCYRAKKQTKYKDCVSCMTDCTFREQLKNRSENTPGEVADHWMFEPCAFQCGLDPDRKNNLTLDESIENNFWYEDEPLDMKAERS